MWAALGFLYSSRIIGQRIRDLYMSFTMLFQVLVKLLKSKIIAFGIALVLCYVLLAGSLT